MRMKVRLVACLSWALFITSFFLPAAWIDVESVLGLRVHLHEPVPGWYAAWRCLASVWVFDTDAGAWWGALNGVTIRHTLWPSIVVLVCGPYVSDPKLVNP